MEKTALRLACGLLCLAAAAPLRAQREEPAAASPRELRVMDRQATQATQCQPWQLGVIQRAAAGASVRSQTAQNTLVGLVAPGPAGSRAGDSQARARIAVRSIFQQDYDLEDMGRSLGEMRNDLATLHGRLYSFVLGRLRDPNIELVCEGAGQTDCAGRAGFVRGHRLPIHLCAGFFAGARRGDEIARLAAIRRDGFDAYPGAPSGTPLDQEEFRLRAMVHESAHVAGIGNGTCEFYFDNHFVCGNDEDRMTVEKCPGSSGASAAAPRSDWADAWSLLVACLTTPGDPPDVVTVPRPRRP